MFRKLRAKGFGRICKKKLSQIALQEGVSVLGYDPDKLYGSAYVDRELLAIVNRDMRMLQDKYGEDLDNNLNLVDLEVEEMFAEQPRVLTRHDSSVFGINTSFDHLVEQDAERDLREKLDPVTYTAEINQLAHRYGEATNS